MQLRCVDLASIGSHSQKLWQIKFWRDFPIVFAPVQIETANQKWRHPMKQYWFTIFHYSPPDAGLPRWYVLARSIISEKLSYNMQMQTLKKNCVLLFWTTLRLKIKARAKFVKHANSLWRIFRALWKWIFALKGRFDVKLID